MAELRNTSFELPDASPGQALYWDEAQDDGSVDVAMFDRVDRTTPFESFEGGWGGNEDSQFSFTPSDLTAALFEGGAHEYENFETSWAKHGETGPPFNHQSAFSYYSENFTAAVFGSDEFESFESGWSDNEDYETDWSGATSALASFDSGTPEDVEDFEEEWDDNEYYAEDWSGATKTAALFDGATNAYENFEGTWTESLD